MSWVLLSMVSAALAKPPEPACPWGPRVTAEATTGGVVIDGMFYSVRGPRAKREFRDLLETCNAQEAIPYFDLWRFHRQAVNVGVMSGATLTVIGVLTAATPVGYVLLSIGAAELAFHTPASAAMAGQAKADMLHAIMAAERLKK